MHVTQDPLPILASFAVSVCGSWRFLYLIVSRKEGVFRSVNNRVERYYAALLYGFCGVWSLHFLALNAFVFPSDVTVSFNVPMMVLSAIFPVVATRLTTFLVTQHASTARPVRTVCLASLIMTLGITLMHYIGFASLSGVMHVHTVTSMLLTVVLAFLTNVMSVWTLMWLPSRQSCRFTWFCITALAMSMGVVVPHFASQWTVSFVYDSAAAWPGVSLAGGAHSRVQTLVVLVNFFLGTVMVSFFKLKEHVSEASEFPGAKMVRMVTPESEVQRLPAKRITLTNLLALAAGGADAQGAGSACRVVARDAETQTDWSDAPDV
uniref:MHYT domain-containing protein n=1 Tax=Zooxanthella nutricula TaxID=1333877 RepID=A0A7S2LMB8_9DINO